jgi:hypothetical protein
MYLLLTFLMVGFWNLGWGQTPAFTISPVSTNFSATVVGTTSASTSFILSGTRLTGVPGTITISAPGSDFQVSVDNSTFGVSATIRYSSATLNNTTFYVRFSPQSAGTKSGTLAVSGGGASANVSVSGIAATSVYYSKFTGSLHLSSTWGTNKDGTGTAPANFSDPQQVFVIQNNPAPTIDGAWTVSGSGSRIVVGDGTSAINFTIPSAFPLKGPIDVTNNAVLTIQNTTNPNLGTLAAGSTVNYAGTGTQTIAVSASYFNLTSSSTGGRILPSGAVKITGTFSPGSNTYTVNRGSTVDFLNSSLQAIPSFNYVSVKNSGNGPRVLSSSGTIGIAGTFDPGTGNYSVTGSTINYNGDIIDTISSFPYNNLTISGTGPYFLVPGTTLTISGNYTQTAGTLNVSTGANSSNTVNIAGSFNMTGGVVKLINSPTSTGATINVAGNCTVYTSTSDGIYMEPAASTTGAAVFVVNGNASFSGTSDKWIDFGTGTALTALALTGNQFQIKGNLSTSGSGKFFTNSINSTGADGIIFNGSGTAANPQTLNYGSISNTGVGSASYIVYTGTRVQLLSNVAIGVSSTPYSSFTVNGTLDCQNFKISGGVSGASIATGFIFNAGGTLITSNPNGIDSTITCKSRYFNAGANYVFNAPAATAFPSSAAQVSFGNPASVTVNASITANRDITISDSLLLNTGTVTNSTNNITLTDGATVKRVEGTLSASPIYGANTGVNVIYAGANSIAGGISSTPLLTPIAGKVNDLTIALTDGTKAVNTSSGSPVTINGSLVLTSGTLVPGDTLTLAGTINRNSGFVDASDQTIIFHSNSTQTIPANMFSGRIKNLTIDNGSGVTLSAGADITVTNALALTAGSLNIAANTLFVNVATGGLTRSTGSIDAGTGKIAFSGNAAVNLPAGCIGGNINNLTISNNAGVILNDSKMITGFLTVDGLLTPAADVVIDGPGSLKGSGIIQVTAAGGDSTNDFRNQYKLAIGSLANMTVEFAGAAAQYAAGDIGGSAKISNSNGVSMTGDATIGKTLTLNSGVLSIGSNTLTLNGPVVNGSGSLGGSIASNLIIGDNAGTLSFSSPGVLKNFTINSGASASLGTALAIEGGAAPGILIVNGTLNTNGHLTLSSTAGGTASLGTSSGSINGNVTVERYIPNSGRRAWQLLTAPVSGTTINASWQEGAVPGSVNNPNPGYGTLITGYTQHTAANATNNGYDFWSAIANSSSSIRSYAGSLNSGGSWVSISNIKGMDISTYPAYLLFVRGDRSVYAADGGTTATTLRATGIPNQGTQSIMLWGSNIQGFTLVGNPFACTIDFDKILTRHSDKLKPQFWRWDAKAGAVYGNYTLVRKDNGSYYTIPSPFTNTGNSSFSGQYIESGQGFFVQPVNEQTTTTGFDIQEKDKVTSVATASPFRRRPLVGGRLFVNLNQYFSIDSSVLVDGVLATFSMNADTTQSVVKQFNFGENLGLSRGNTVLIMEAHKPVSRTDTLKLKLWNTSKRSYQLQCKAEGWERGIWAYLVDNYLKKATPVNLTGDITTINFSIDTNAASAAQDRFMIVFKYSGALLSTLLNVRKGKDSIATDKDAPVTVYPNPVRKSRIINIKVTNIAAGNYQFSLYDGSGKRLLIKKIVYRGGSSSEQMNLPKAVAKGIYYLELADATGKVIEQVPVIIIE